MQAAETCKHKLFEGRTTYLWMDLMRSGKMAFGGMTQIDDLERRRDELLGELAAVGDFRPGRLIGITRKCGKAACRCARPDAPGHSGWALTRRIKGRLARRGVPRHALERTREQVAEYERFKALSRRFVEANEALCRARPKGGPGRGAGRRKRGAREQPAGLFTTDLTAEIERLSGSGADELDFERFETAVRRRALGLAERRLNISSTTFTEYAGVRRNQTVPPSAQVVAVSVVSALT